MVSKLLKYKYQSLLFFTVLILAVANYTPGTWLTGWDNSHPEFNFGLNISRTFTAVWREHRGVGLVSGLAHPAQIFRYLFLWLTSIIIPESFLRYFWQFLMLLLGPLGVYYCSKSVFFKHCDLEKQERTAFVASLFYLLNLVTLQTFYVPLETFTTQYGFLPWLLLYVFKLPEQPNKNNLAVFTFLNIVSASQAFTPTLFFAYISFVLLVFISHVVIVRSKVTIKKVGLISLSIIISNLYWLMPFGYFVMSGNAGKISDATINVLSSEESFLMNKQHGNIGDLSVLRGFLFTTTDFNYETNSYEWLLDRWIIYQSSTAVKLAGYALFSVVLIGLATSLVDLKRRADKVSHLVLILFFLVAGFFLVGDNPPTGFVFRFLQDKLPFFGEALRFPFTKYSILAGFTYAVLFGVGFNQLWQAILRPVKRPFGSMLAGSLVFVSIASALVFWTLPMFQGDLIYRRMRVKIPQDYFLMFDWFNQQKDEGRILKLPIQTYWSWGFNDWGYRGSGFTWYGIKQPTFDRAFDVWSPSNESMYREISYAVYSNDASLFKDVLKKYGVSHMLLDDSVFEPMVSRSSRFMGLDTLATFLADSRYYKQVQSFGDLKIYTVLDSGEGVKLMSSLQNISPVVSWLPKDAVYQDGGKYYTGDLGLGKVYPFRGLGNYLTTKSDYTITSSNDHYNVNYNLLQGGTLQIPDYFAKEQFTQAKLSIVQGELTILSTLPKVFVNNREIVFNNTESLYKVKLPSRIPKAFLVSIDRDVYGPFNSINVGEADLGAIVLDTTRGHDVGVWDVDSAKRVDLMPLYQNAEVDSCINQDAGFYELERLDGSIRLTSVNNTACIAVTAGLVSDLGLIKLEYGGSFDNAEINYCIYGKSDCLNDKKYDKEYLHLGKMELPFTVQFYSTPVNNERPAISEFKDINLVKYPLITSSYLEPLSVENRQRLQTRDVYINAGTLTVEIPKPINYKKAYIFEDFDNPDLKSITHECNFNSEVKVDTDFKKTLNFVKKEIEVTTEGKSSCFTLANPYLSHSTGYFIEIPFMRTSGKAQKFCLQNSYTERCDLIYKLEAREKGVYQKGHFFVPRYTDGGQGYKLTLENTSIGNDRSVNSYDDIGVYPFPFDFVESIKVTDSGLASPAITNGTVSPAFSKVSSFIYRVNIAGVSNGQVLSLNQAYESGWLAFCGFNFCPANHVVVNNWANGWVFNQPFANNTAVTIIFWPQLLEYLGFIASGLWTFYLLKRRN